ncbi:GNAT family N-acetyltransferase [uncultured Roseibium sp.]|uniref:GNAT family N-acetyltransferase n=1 Tax=uncultured Roseibium sp. TaxID=1936171 RepID=UPI00260F99EA|nr:GNAT family N-acetyltransferase [uncultured Roseibium sp.]
MNQKVAEVRRIGSDEVEVFKRIRLEALQLEPNSFASSYEDWIELSDDEWRRRMRNPVLVAFLDDQPVGITGLLRQSASKMAHRATIVMVYVRESLRGKGIAKDLLEAVVGEARVLGIQQLELSASAENLPALRFYRREGFVEAGRIPGGFIQEGRLVDDIMMIRRLEAAAPDL